MKKAIPAALIALTLFSAVPLRANEDPNNKNQGMERMIENMTKLLELTPDQQQKVRAALEEKHTKMEPLRQEQKKISEEIEQKIESILNASQKTKYEKIQENHRGRMDNGRRNMKLDGPKK